MLSNPLFPVVMPLALACVLGLSACASPVAKPAFYPNAHYQKVGAEQANTDYKDCIDLADKSNVGAINKLEVLQAAVTPRASMAGTMMRQEIGGSAVYRSFMQTCLVEKGYRIIGWK
jgi:hypothetical protein